MQCLETASLACARTLLVGFCAITCTIERGHREPSRLSAHAFHRRSIGCRIVVRQDFASFTAFDVLGRALFARGSVRAGSQRQRSRNRPQEIEKEREATVRGWLRHPENAAASKAAAQGCMRWHRLGVGEMKQLRILIADDHEFVRCGIRGLLQVQRGWKVAGEATNGREAVEKAAMLKPDVAIIDFSMPELDGLQATRQIREAAPNTEIVMLTMHESGQMVRRVMGAGALGYVLKSDLAACLVKAVRDASRGRRFLSPKVSQIVVEGFLTTENQSARAEDSQVRLTPRELQVIQLLAQGSSNKVVAAELRITVRTVETHRAKIMLKLGLHSIGELIQYAIRKKIITISDN